MGKSGADKVIINSIKNVQAMLEVKFTDTRNPDYLEARNKLEDALVVLYEID